VTAVAAEAPLPVTSDPDSQGFFEAAERGELALRFCCACGHTIHLPMSVCDQCHSWNTEWRTVRLRGKVYTFTIAERQVHPAFPAPYAVVLVELDDAPEARLLSHMPGTPALHIGMPVEGFFERVQSVNLLRWRPFTDGGNEQP
jgi:uncharacterized OB-fold protein